jgi:hypothetical protein
MSEPRKFRGFGGMRFARVGVTGVLVTCDGMLRDAVLAVASSGVISPWAGPHSHAGSVQSHPASAYTAGVAEAGGWNARTVAPGGHLQTRSLSILLWGLISLTAGRGRGAPRACARAPARWRHYL